MTRRRLDNDDWGFESSCFVCERRNERGLRIPFFHDDESCTVVAEFNLGPEFSGAPSYVHGGVVLSVLDEAMAWATIAVAQAMAMTRTTTATFLHPVRVGRPYAVEARLDATRPDGVLELSAEVRSAGGRPCAEARAEFVSLSAEQATAALGTEATGADAGFVKG
jgi:uncharacterized protein (TIGR00369 family)